MNDEQKQEGILERLRNSPRTVSTIIVILIIAGAIFAFSERGDTPVNENATEEVAVVNEEENTEETTEELTEEQNEVVEEDEEEATQEEQPLPEPEETADTFVEVAQPGDGITHLTRRATTKFLESNPPGFEITNEHRVYIEDHIRRHVSSGQLNIGDQVTIQKELVQEAVAASERLTDAQLQNLQKFSQLVDWN